MRMWFCGAESRWVHGCRKDALRFHRPKAVHRGKDILQGTRATPFARVALLYTVVY